ncbi:MAG: thiol:disulfide interchange protein DsbA/DsbL [Aquabacterium sp.]|nr:MAG: thiol:disulfide interchange protein DsbA/DsbL [Aquabacterium sp.]
MNRREFSIWAASSGVAGSALLTHVAAHAQYAMPPEGSFVKLARRAPTKAPKGQVEVLEFFWYGCPHCNAFEPFIEAWAAKLPSDVFFRRIPVIFRENPFAIHQRLYFALEALGEVKNMQRKVFNAIHVDQKRLDERNAIADFVAANGIDRTKFLEAFDSPSIKDKREEARQLADAYKIDGVPALGIGGQYFTSVSQAGSHEKALTITNALIAQVRRTR